MQGTERALQLGFPTWDGISFTSVLPPLRVNGHIFSMQRNAQTLPNTSTLSAP
jgi:hypothetical protein